MTSFSCGPHFFLFLLLPSLCDFGSLSGHTSSAMRQNAIPSPLTFKFAPSSLFEVASFMFSCKPFTDVARVQFSNVPAHIISQESKLHAFIALFGISTSYKYVDLRLPVEERIHRIIGSIVLMVISPFQPARSSSRYSLFALFHLFSLMCVVRETVSQHSR